VVGQKQAGGLWLKVQLCPDYLGKTQGRNAPPSSTPARQMLNLKGKDKWTTLSPLYHTVIAILFLLWLPPPHQHTHTPHTGAHTLGLV